jgi:alpha-L-rhamnosidase
MITIQKLRTEHLNNPMGITALTPRFSWQLCSDSKSIVQTAYEIQAGYDKTFTNLLWQSGKVESDQSIAVPYAGPALHSMERIYWRVKIWTQQMESDFSDPAFFEMGLLDASDWVGVWLETEHETDPNADHQEPLIRKAFQLNKKVKQARIYATAHGLYEGTLNGKAITQDLFLPGRTVYCDRLQYQVYDITDLLQDGENVLGIMLGDGWWRGSSSATNAHNRFGYKVGFLCQLVLFYEMKISKMIQFENTNPPRKRRNKGFRHIRCCRESLFFVPWNDCV